MEVEVKPIITVICEAVGKHYYCSVEDIDSRSRSLSVTQARMVAMYVVRTKLGLSWPEVGREFGRDHTTALVAVKKVQGRLENERVAAAVRAGVRVAEEWSADA